jgi:hypothetical protein
MKHSITNRLIVGKTIGLVVGLAVFLIAPLLGITLDLKFGLGLIFFYTLLGAMIAFVGMFEKHPILNFKMPWWFRGLVMGLVMHAMLVLLSYDQLVIMLQEMNFLGLTSPWWALVDGAILGLVMAFAETKFAGEGKLPLK